MRDEAVRAENTSLARVYRRRFRVSDEFRGHYEIRRDGARQYRFADVTREHRARHRDYPQARRRTYAPVQLQHEPCRLDVDRFYGRRNPHVSHELER